MTENLPSLTSTEFIRNLERNGFRSITNRKKHRIYTDGVHIVPVPFHERDLKPVTLRTIMCLAGWTLAESEHLPSLTPTEYIRSLEPAGFRRITKREKHRFYTDGTLIVPVPFHARDLKLGTERSIHYILGATYY